uniref:Cas12f1-like TNB domain-containing protein n=1 Tax=Globisporangium ultimum (strain ATCC 200006 / CBS 805.95 / DAOM BR144) TaxID=431595 RepID=K3X0X3_GLOUD
MGMRRALFGLVTCLLDLLKQLPTLQISSFEDYLNQLQVAWKHLGLLGDFSTKHTFRKWRFYQTRFRQKALHGISRQLVPTPDPKVCVAIGNWRSQTCLRGHAHGPVKCLTRELEKRATVLVVDEYRTSKRWSRCLHELCNKTYPVVGEDSSVSRKRSYAVLCCSNLDCGTTWDRDMNGAINTSQLAN